MARVVGRVRHRHARRGRCGQPRTQCPHANAKRNAAEVLTASTAKAVLVIVIRFTDLEYFLFVFQILTVGIGFGWVLAWRYYDKYGGVGAAFVKRDWPRKPPPEQLP